MKLASFKIGNSSTWGVIEGEEALDVGARARGSLSDLKSAIAADALPAVRDAMREAKAHPHRRHQLAAGRFQIRTRFSASA